MPTYTYQCSKCEHTMDIFHAMSASPKVKCEMCGGRCERLLGTGAGIIFKGSGFYETDFKKKNGKPPAKTESAAKGGDEKSAKTESKKVGKSEKKVV